MDEAIDRVITNENRLYAGIKNYSPLVETYIQNLKPDKDLGYVPRRAIKYFLGRADFSRGVSLVSLSDSNGKGKKISARSETSSRSRCNICRMDFLQMIFIDTNGFDKQHYKFDYVQREFLGEVRCLVFDVTPLRKAARDASPAASGWKTRASMSFASTVPITAADTRVGISISTAGAPTCSRASGCRHLSTAKKRSSLRAEQEARFQSADAASGVTTLATPRRNRTQQDPVEGPANDETTTANDLSPIQAQRSWDRQAERQRCGPLATHRPDRAEGEVDKVLETVVNNLEVTKQH